VKGEVVSEHKDHIEKANKKLLALYTASQKECVCNIRYGEDENEACERCRAVAYLEEILDFIDCFD